MEILKCPLCGSSSIRKKRGSYPLNLKGKLVSTPVVHYWKCSHCGEAYFDKAANRRIDEKLLRHHRRKVS